MMENGNFSSDFFLNSCKKRDEITLPEEYILATIVKTTGSTYQKAGAYMLIHPDGHQEGLWGGICVMAKIIETSKIVAQSKQTQLLKIDTRSADDLLFGYGTGCQGQQEILLESLTSAQDKQYETWKNKKHVRAIIFYSDDRTLVGQRLFLCHDASSFFSNLSQIFAETIKQHAKKVLQQEQSECQAFTLQGIHCETSFIFHKPVPSLHIFGIGNDALALQKLASWMEWDVHLYDHRSFYELDPSLSNTNPQMAVLMSHNFMKDLLILEKLVTKNLTYIGLLGPKQRGELLLKELAKTQTLPNYENIYFPIGLNLGGRAPNEIALSVVAQLQALYQGNNAA